MYLGSVEGLYSGTCAHVFVPFCWVNQTKLVAGVDVHMYGASWEYVSRSADCVKVLWIPEVETAGVQSGLTEVERVGQRASSAEPEVTSALKEGRDQTPIRVQIIVWTSLEWMRYYLHIFVLIYENSAASDLNAFSVTAILTGICEGELPKVYRLNSHKSGHPG